MAIRSLRRVFAAMRNLVMSTTTLIVNSSAGAICTTSDLHDPRIALAFLRITVARPARCIRDHNEARRTVMPSLRSGYRKRVLAGCVALSLTLIPRGVYAQTPNAVKSVPFGIIDNSFPVEEAFNQEAGVFQNIVNFVREGPGTWVATITQEWPIPNLTPSSPIRCL